MIMSYIQRWLIGLWRGRPGVVVPIEQVRQVPSGSHRQPLSNPTDRDGGFGPKPGGQPHLERMALAPACELLLRNTVAAQRLGDKALRLGFSRKPCAADCTDWCKRPAAISSLPPGCHSVGSTSNRSCEPARRSFGIPPPTTPGTACGRHRRRRLSPGGPRGSSHGRSPPGTGCAASEP